MAITRLRKKRCRFCKEPFLPNPRLKDRQLACSKAQCQRQRNKANQKRWLKKHPGYFKGQYYKTKQWRQAHPSYQRQWRRKHPEKAQRDNLARKQRRLLAKSARAEIQNSKLLQPPIIKALRPSLAATSGAEIQNSIMPEVVWISVFSTRFAATLRRRDTKLDRSRQLCQLRSPA